jgi:hypothetical protein
MPRDTKIDFTVDDLRSMLQRQLDSMSGKGIQAAGGISVNDPLAGIRQAIKRRQGGIPSPGMPKTTKVPGATMW